MDTKNQSGQAMILFTIVGTLAMTVLFSSFTIYWQSQLRTQSRIREAYNLMNAMEQAGKDIRIAWDQSAATLPGPAQVPCVANPATPADVQLCAANIQGNMAAVTPDPACSAACTTGTAGVPTLCYANPLNPNSPYCFYGSNFPSAARLNFEILNPGEKPDSFFWRMAERFTKFIENDIHFFGEKATAATPVRTDIVGVSPVCVGATPAPGCMVCGAGSGRVCLSIYACPAAFASCAAYDGTAAKALFVQQFTLIPPNDPN